MAKPRQRDTLEERFLAHLEGSGMIPDGAKVLVGYSGGADSTCLLRLLHSCGVDVVAAHLHHGQRPEADAEAERCAKFCEGLGVPFVMGRADVPRIAVETGVGLEEAGRNARYEFFRQAARSTGCSLIATAHTRSDQAETVMLNATRGCGLSGLSGIPEQRENVIRPLLPFSRQETVAYCSEHGLIVHEDPANMDLSFARARVRHRVLPELAAINPSVEAALARLANLADEEDRFLDAMAAAALERCEVRLNGKLGFLSDDVEAAFDAGSLGSLPPVLSRRALRLVAGVLGATLDSSHVGAVLEGIRTGSPGSVTAEGGEVAIEWDERRLAARVVAPDTLHRHPLEVPGELASEVFGWLLELKDSTAGSLNPERDAMEVEIDGERIQGPLHVRSLEDGDSIQPLGFQGSRKLSDVLSEAGLTRAARRRLPIVCDMIGPVWAPGVCLSERVRTGSGTHRAIRMRFAALDDTDRSLDETSTAP